MSMARGRGQHCKRSVIAHPNHHAHAGMLAAMTELYSNEPGMSSEDALAEKERLRLEDEAKATGQQQLRFGALT